MKKKAKAKPKKKQIEYQVVDADGNGNAYDTLEGLIEDIEKGDLVPIEESHSNNSATITKVEVLERISIRVLDEMRYKVEIIERNKPCKRRIKMEIKQTKKIEKVFQPYSIKIDIGSEPENEQINTLMDRVMRLIGSGEINSSDDREDFINDIIEITNSNATDEYKADE